MPTGASRALRLAKRRHRVGPQVRADARPRVLRCAVPSLPKQRQWRCLGPCSPGGREKERRPALFLSPWERRGPFRCPCSEMGSEGRGAARRDPSPTRGLWPGVDPHLRAVSVGMTPKTQARRCDWRARRVPNAATPRAAASPPACPPRSRRRRCGGSCCRARGRNRCRASSRCRSRRACGGRNPGCRW